MPIHRSRSALLQNLTCDGCGRQSTSGPRVGSTGGGAYRRHSIPKALRHSSRAAVRASSPTATTRHGRTSANSRRRNRRQLSFSCCSEGRSFGGWQCTTLVTNRSDFTRPAAARARVISHSDPPRNGSGGYSMHAWQSDCPISITGAVSDPYPGADPVTPGTLRPGQRRHAATSLARRSRSALGWGCAGRTIWSKLRARVVEKA